MQKGKVHIKKEERVYKFLGLRKKEKLRLWISGSKEISFPTQEIGRKTIFPYGLFSSQKVDENMIFTWLF